MFLHFGQGEAFIGDDEVAIAHQALRGEVIPKSIASVMSTCCECVDAEEEDEEMGCGGSVSHWQLSDKRSDSSRRHRGMLKAAIQKVFLLPLSGQISAAVIAALLKAAIQKVFSLPL